MIIRVIIAEDHTVVREGTRRLLEQSGDIQVVGEAADGEEAVRLAAELRPDLVLMDIALPRLNGIEATRRIKAEHPQIAVLAITGYDDDAYVFALMDAGAAGYMLKTVYSEDLIRAIRAVHAGERVLSPSVAWKMLRQFSPSGRAAPAGETKDTPTDREREVLRLAAHGLTNKAIAQDLSLSPRTVQIHLGHIFEKLRVASRTEAVIVGLRRGWVRLEDMA